VPSKTFYLSQKDRNRLTEAGRPQIGSMPAGTYARRILEQLLVDLSWASSRMEGNTYDILQTERLIRFGEEAAGKDRKEALMILNHKEAIQYVVDNLGDIGLQRTDLFNLHALLSDGLLSDPAMSGRLRALPVGISHSSYQPLDDPLLIEEEFDIVLTKAAQIPDRFEQSFFLLVHIPYLQAFADVNKRTSRVASNIPLLKADLAPMSFMTMEDRDYIDGLIGIYELNDITLFREVYLDAYIASAEKYRVLRAEVASPVKAALAYREFVREAIRHCVLEQRQFRESDVQTMASEAGVPLEDLAGVVSYIREQYEGLHEGNAIRYRLSPDDLIGLKSA
jgi:Fic family protein